IYARDQLPTSRGSSPTNITQFISIAIFAQALEFAPGSANPRMALLHFNLPAADQIDGMLTRFFQVRINRDLLLGLCDGPALRDAHGALISNVDCTEFDVATLAWNDLVGSRHLAARAAFHLEFRSFRTQACGDIVDQASIDHHS